MDNIFSMITQYILYTHNYQDYKQKQKKNASDNSNIKIKNIERFF